MKKKTPKNNLKIDIDLKKIIYLLELNNKHLYTSQRDLDLNRRNTILHSIKATLIILMIGLIIYDGIKKGNLTPLELIGSILHIIAG